MNHFPWAKFESQFQFGQFSLTLPSSFVNYGHCVMTKLTHQLPGSVYKLDLIWPVWVAALWWVLVDAVRTNWPLFINWVQFGFGWAGLVHSGGNGQCITHTGHFVCYSHHTRHSDNSSRDKAMSKLQILKKITEAEFFCFGPKPN